MEAGVNDMAEEGASPAIEGRAVGGNGFRPAVSAMGLSDGHPSLPESRYITEYLITWIMYLAGASAAMPQFQRTPVNLHPRQCRPSVGGGSTAWTCTTSPAETGPEVAGFELSGNESGWMKEGKAKWGPRIGN